MKKTFLFAMMTLGAVEATQAQVGIGTTTPNASAALEVSSTSKGLLPPRMTTAQRNAISNAATGLVIFNTTTNSLEVNTGTPASPTWTAYGPTNLYNTDGNLTGNRLVGLNNNNLWFTGTGSALARVHPTLGFTAAADSGKWAWLSGGNNTGSELQLTGPGSAHFSIYNKGDYNLTFANTSAGGPNVAGTPLMAITNTGKVGIGTTTPSRALHVNGGNGISLTSGVANVDGYMALGRTAEEMDLGVAGNSNAGLAGTAAGDGWMKATTNMFVGSINGSFNVVTGGATRITANASGNVGIGTSSPAGKLHVAGNIYQKSNATQWVTLESSANTVGQGSILEFVENGNQYGTVLRHSTGSDGSQAEGLHIEAKDAGNYGTGYNIATFDQVNKRVGVGTATPTERLDVNGNAVATYLRAKNGLSAGGNSQVVLTNSSASYTISSNDFFIFLSTGYTGNLTTLNSPSLPDDGHILIIRNNTGANRTFVQGYYPVNSLSTTTTIPNNAVTVLYRFNGGWVEISN